MEQIARTRWTWLAVGLVAGAAIVAVALRGGAGAGGARGGDGARAHLALGREALEAGRTEEAVEAFAHAARLDPGDDEADRAVMRARARLITERPELVTRENAAAWAYEMKFLLRGEEDRRLQALYHTAAGFVAARAGDGPGAIAAYRAAVAADPERPDAVAALGCALAADESTRAQAKPYLEATLAKTPKHPAALRGMGRVLLAGGDAKGAVEVLERSAEVEPSWETRSLLGEARLQLGDPAGALREVEAALAENPNGGAALALRARIRGEAGGPGGAAGAGARSPEEGRDGARSPGDEAGPAADGAGPRSAGGDRHGREGAQGDRRDDGRGSGDASRGQEGGTAPRGAPVFTEESAKLVDEMTGIEQDTEALANTLNDLTAALRAGNSAVAERVLAGEIRGRSLALGPPESEKPYRWVDLQEWHLEGDPAVMAREVFVKDLQDYLSTFASIESLRLKITDSDPVAGGGLHGKVKLRLVGRDAEKRRVWIKGKAAFDARQIDARWEVSELAFFQLERFVARREIFADVSKEAGILTIAPLAPTGHRNDDIAYGAAAIDLDEDGLLDVFVVGRDRHYMYMNNGDGTFREESEAVNLRRTPPGLDATAPLFLDYDNDGDPDLFLSGFGRQVLMENRRIPDGQTRFVDVSVQRGVDHRAAGMTAATGDVNGDGRPDIYVTSYNEGSEAFHQIHYSEARNGTPNLLLVSTPDGGYAEVAQSWGVADTRWSFCAELADIDDDGDLDLYVTNDFGGGSTAYMNEGGRFVDRGLELGLMNRGYGMGTSFGDYDNDGDLDFFLTGMSSTAGGRILERLSDEQVGSRELLKMQAAGSQLFRNEGGHFTNVTESAGPFPAGWAWGGKFIDIDNDGWVDIHSPNGFRSGMSLDDT